MVVVLGVVKRAAAAVAAAVEVRVAKASRGACNMVLPSGVVTSSLDAAAPAARFDARFAAALDPQVVMRHRLAG